MQDRFHDEGRFSSPNASRYLQQLCKHFAHKVEARFDAHAGHVALPMGPVALAAKDDELVVTVSADDAAGLVRARKVIDDHLARFAFREGFERLAWQGR